MNVHHPCFASDELKRRIVAPFRKPGSSQKHLGLCYVGDSTELLMAGLLYGYRLVQPGPYRTRAMLDVQNGDVHFDTTETYVARGPEDLEQPIYYTSIKESVKAGKRYEFRHQANNGSNSLPCVEKEADSFWVLDNSWIALQHRDSLEYLMILLKENILHGREVRMVVGGEISTDVTSSTLTPTDVILTLTKYLTPFKGVESKNVATQAVRFPVLGLNSSKLIECELDYMTDTLKGIDITTLTSNIDWYVSSRHWTQVLEIGPNKAVISGSLDVLIEVASKHANNIRVCVLEVSGNTLCHGGSKITVENGRLFLQSVSMLNVVVDESHTLEGVQGHCELSYRIMDAGGKVESLSYVAGTKYKNTTTINFEKQYWFVEY